MTFANFRDAVSQLVRVARESGSREPGGGLTITVDSPDVWLAMAGALEREFNGMLVNAPTGLARGEFKFNGVLVVNPTIRDHEGSKYIEAWSRAMAA